LTSEGRCVAKGLPINEGYLAHEPSVIGLHQEEQQQSEATIGQSDSNKHNSVSEIDKPAIRHDADENTGFRQIGRIQSAESSQTHCSHRTRFPVESSSRKSTARTQRSPSSNNEKPWELSWPSPSSNCTISQCTCSFRSGSIAQEIDPVISTAEQVGSTSSPPSDLVFADAEGPLRTRQALGKSITQPLQLIERREKHNAIPEVQSAFQQSRDTIEAEMDTEWWLNLATWWLVKVSLTDDENRVLS